MRERERGRETEMYLNHYQFDVCHSKEKGRGLKGTIQNVGGDLVWERYGD